MIDVWSLAPSTLEVSIFAMLKSLGFRIYVLMKLKCGERLRREVSL